MLQAMHEGAGSKILKFVLFGLIGFAMVGLAFTDVGGFFRNGGIGSNTVAVIGSDAIGVSGFYRQYQDMLRQANIDSQTAKAINYPYKALQQEITRRVLLQAAWKAKLRIGEEYVANQLAKQLDELGVSADQRDEFFKDYLRRTGLSEAQIIGNIRQDAATTLMMDAVQQPLEAPLFIAQQIYRFEKEKRSADTIAITYNSIKDIPHFSDTEIEEFYKTNPALSAIPETRDVSYVVISKDKFLKEQNISDEQIQNYYEDNIASFTVPTARRFEQVIVDSQEKADKIAVALESGKASLETAAKTALGDSGYDYVAADYYTIKDLPDEIKTAVFAEDKTAFPFISDVIKTSYGFHIINVMGAREAQQKPLTDALKKEIVAYLKDTQSEEAVYKTTEELEDKAASGMTLAEVAKELDLDVKIVKQTTSQGQSLGGSDLTKGVPNAAEILNSAFSLYEGEISPVIEGENLTLIAVGVSNIVAASQKPLDAVKQDVKDALEQRYQSTQAREKADKILEKFKAGDTPLQALAKEFNVPYTQTPLVERIATSKDAIVPQDVRNALFRLTDKTGIDSMKTDDGITLIALNTIDTPKDLPTKGTEIDDLKQGIGQAISADIVEEFVGYWRNRLGVKVNDNVMQQYFFKADEE